MVKNDDHVRDPDGIPNRILWRYWLPVIVWTLLIFIASSLQFHYDPDSRSFEEDYGKFTDFKDSNFWFHLGEFGIFTLLLFFALKYGTKNWSFDPALSAVGIGFIHSVFDEIHQYFVPTRSCSIGDVIFDFFGIILGVILAILIDRLWVGKR